MKKITMNIFPTFFFFISVSLIVFGGSTEALATACLVDGPDGSWKITKNRNWNYYYKKPWPTDFSCDLSGTGDLVSDSNGYYTYELVSGEQKAVESISSCENIRSCMDDPNGSINNCNYCNGHLDPNNPCSRRVWPPCLTTNSFLPCNTTDAQCETGTCTYNCDTCSEGLRFEQRYGGMTCLGSKFCFATVVTGRTLYQWVCNDCVNPVNLYQQFKNDCGVDKIVSWDNETCTGVCKPDPQNQGPPEQCQER